MLKYIYFNVDSRVKTVKAYELIKPHVMQLWNLESVTPDSTEICFLAYQSPHSSNFKFQPQYTIRYIEPTIIFILILK